jgi:hypothetical protein
MQMIYLLGVDHSFQHNGNPPCDELSLKVLEPLRKEFAVYLKGIVLLLNLKWIAEEFNEDALKMSHASQSLAKSVACELKICHIFCDPGCSERASLGISKKGQKEDCDKREKYWLTVIQSNNVTDVLFICCAKHLADFRNLLAEQNYNTEVINNFYKQSYCKKAEKR